MGQTSTYSNAIVSLNPAAYWPLQETTPPPAADVETNLGSFGPIANMYYASTNCAPAQPGAIAADADTCINFLGNASSFGLVPTTDNRISLPANQPFTIEAWVRPTGGQNYVSMINQTGHNGNGGPINQNTSCGWMLCENYSAAWTDFNVVNGNHPAAWSFHVFNGLGDSGGAEAQVPNGNYIAGGANGYQNCWTYLCGVFDGTNAWLYIYSTNLNNSVNGGTNASTILIPITTGPSTVAGVPGTNAPTATFTPDTWDPIQFDGSRGFGANPYHGYVDEVAIYTNALTFTQITNHFMAGTNGLGSYSSTVLGDGPVMYWRMDAPKYTPPPVSSYPAAANYGSTGANITNFNTLGNSAVYQPGSLPGAGGPQYPGFGPFTNACAFNGLVGAVDAGYQTLLDPTGFTNNFTVVTWFKGNPMDNNSRWNAIASHSDSSWKLFAQNSSIKVSKGAGTQGNIAPATFNVNDGNWHMLTLVSTYTNGVGTNVMEFVDNCVASNIVVNISANVGKPASDVFIGNGPEYLEPTNLATYNTSQQTFAGRVAHLAYFTNALTVNQIKNLYYAANPIPFVVGQLSSPSVVPQNGSITNSVLAGGASPLSYQWYTNGVALVGATNASIIFTNVPQTYNGLNYYIVVTNVYGVATSSVASMQVLTNLTAFVQFPVTYTNPITLYGGSNIGGTNYLGSSPSFSVSAVGALPIAYQWVTNGVAVGWATSSSFTFTNCQMTSPTNFACILNNSYGSMTSSVWSVSYQPTTIAPFPQLTLAYNPMCYWRLNEPDDNNSDGNPGAICNDYQSGNNGIYTNVYLSRTGYDTNTDANETAAQFAYFMLTSCDANSIGTNIDFSVPAGGNGEFSVMVWANGDSLTQVANSGLVAKGYFFGEEFTLDEGAAGNDVRFEVHDAAANTYNAGSTVNLGADSNWHFIVGVCDEANGVALLYVDKVLVGSVAIPANAGIINSAAVPLMIGARSSTAATPGNNQFRGLLNEAAVFNYALSSTQIANLFQAAGSAPEILQQPLGSVNFNSGNTLIISPQVAGTTPLYYQWVDNSGPVAGQTNSTLVISNYTTVGDSFYLTASNSFGVATSSSESVNVYSGLPTIVTDVTTPFYGTVGGNATNFITAYGSAPLGFQWQVYNGSTWVNLANSSRIGGTLGSALTITNVQGSDVGNYQVVVYNGSGSVTSSVATLIVPGVLPLQFYNNTANGWTAGGSARFNTGSGVLSLTDPANGGGNGSFFFQFPLYIKAFQASFTYQAAGNMAADGVTFCLQNDFRGVSALGSAGGQLGYGGASAITPSVALELNIFTGNGLGGVGYAFGANGSVNNVTAPGSVNLSGGDPIAVLINYANGQMSLTFTDAIASTSYSTVLNVGDITQNLGANTAYVGFTGSYGGQTSVQTISNFQFISIPTAGINLLNNNSSLISWPGSVLGYTLQQNSDLTTTNWMNVTNVNILSNGLNQVTAPTGGPNMFYRLILPQ
ncbi:MAG TPA: LamG-like jellyroll fold domain-containing protein [Candidatus Sulfotelmatobacter sp.]|nr:LamG-like jellyroll fold domain-containing protein [Candidatus Sulfotelmatobacter sp.]